MMNVAEIRGGGDLMSPELLQRFKDLQDTAENPRISLLIKLLIEAFEEKPSRKFIGYDTQHNKEKKK